MNDYSLRITNILMPNFLFKCYEYLFSKKYAKIKIDEYKSSLSFFKRFELITGKISFGNETE